MWGGLCPRSWWRGAWWSELFTMMTTSPQEPGRSTWGGGNDMVHNLDGNCYLYAGLTFTLVRPFPVISSIYRESRVYNGVWRPGSSTQGMFTVFCMVTAFLVSSCRQDQLSFTRSWSVPNCKRSRQAQYCTKRFHTVS